MNSYRIYNLHDIDLNEVYAYSKYSVGKFEYLFGHEGTTKFYYKYNFFTLASCNKEIHKMYRQLTGFVGEFLSEVSYPDDNVWMQSWVAEDGGMASLPPLVEKGDSIDFRAEMDLMAVYSVCPDETSPCNDFKAKPLKLQILEGSDNR